MTMESKAGKGDLQRPKQNPQSWDENYERTFGMTAEDWPKCGECEWPYEFDYEGPFAWCACPGITEWGSAGRPENWANRQSKYLGHTYHIRHLQRDTGDENDYKEKA